MNAPNPSTFELIRVIRETRSTKGAERMLLLMLALRCQPAKEYIAWPSYRQLAEDTMLDDMTLRRAAKRLAEKNLISFSMRANRTNLFYLNVHLILDEAAAARADRQDEGEWRTYRCLLYLFGFTGAMNLSMYRTVLATIQAFPPFSALLVGPGGTGKTPVMWRSMIVSRLAEHAI